MQITTETNCPHCTRDCTGAARPLIKGKCPGCGYTAQTTDTTKIMDKIRKCLALGSSPVPAEAAAALARAQELMAKYGISAEVLENKVSADDVVEEGVRSIATASRCKPWELRLFLAIADAFGCQLMFVRGRDPETLRALGQPDRLKYATYQFIGLRQEAAVAKYAAEVLQRQLSRCRAQFTQTLADYLQRGEKTMRVDSYCEGWVLGASTKLPTLSSARKAEAEKAESAGTASPGTALMVVSKEEQTAQAITSYVEAHAGGRSKSQTRRGHFETYAQQGYRDGLKAEVNRAIGSTAGQGTAQLYR
jgi:hypothetical protein